MPFARSLAFSLSLCDTPCLAVGCRHNVLDTCSILLALVILWERTGWEKHIHSWSQMKSSDGHPETRCWADLGEAGPSHSSEYLISWLVTFPPSPWWNETQLPQPLGQALCRTSLLLSSVRCSCAWHNTHVVSESTWWHLLIPIWYCIFFSILQCLVRVSLQESFAYVVFSPISLALHRVLTVGLALFWVRICVYYMWSFYLGISHRTVSDCIRENYRCMCLETFWKCLGQCLASTYKVMWRCQVPRLQASLQEKWGMGSHRWREKLQGTGSLHNNFFQAKGQAPPFFFSRFSIKLPIWEQWNYWLPGIIGFLARKEEEPLNWKRKIQVVRDACTAQSWSQAWHWTTYCWGQKLGNDDLCDTSWATSLPGEVT